MRIGPLLGRRDHLDHDAELDRHMIAGRLHGPHHAVPPIQPELQVTALGVDAEVVAHTLPHRLRDVVDGPDHERVTTAGYGHRSIPHQLHAFELDLVRRTRHEPAARDTHSLVAHLREGGLAQVEVPTRARKHHGVRLLVQGVGGDRGDGAVTLGAQRFDLEGFAVQPAEQRIAAASRVCRYGAALQDLAEMDGRPADAAL